MPAPVAPAAPMPPPRPPQLDRVRTALGDALASMAALSALLPPGATSPGGTTTLVARDFVAEQLRALDALVIAAGAEPLPGYAGLDTEAAGSVFLDASTAPTVMGEPATAGAVAATLERAQTWARGAAAAIMARVSDATGLSTVRAIANACTELVRAARESYVHVVAPGLRRALTAWFTRAVNAVQRLHQAINDTLNAAGSAGFGLGFAVLALVGLYLFSTRRRS